MKRKAPVATTSNRKKKTQLVVVTREDTEPKSITMTITQIISNAAKQNKNWLTWFNSRDSGTVINQSQQETLFKTFDASIATDEFITQLEQHNETVFMHKVNFGTNRVTLFHHLRSSGGTLYESGVKEYGMIQGLTKVLL